MSSWVRYLSEALCKKGLEANVSLILTPRKATALEIRAGASP